MELPRLALWHVKNGPDNKECSGQSVGKGVDVVVLCIVWS